MAGLVGLCVTITLMLQGCLAQQFRDSPANSLALTTYPFTLSCSAPDPTPPFAITWLHNAMTASSDSRINITYNMSTGRSQYVISSVSYFDAGTYQCFGMDAQGQMVSRSATGTLTVQGRPSFSPSLPAVEISSGERAVFNCSVVSNPPAMVSWAFGNPPQTLSSNERIIISNSNTTLTINSVRTSDEGFYECIATNGYGRNSTSGRLTIIAPTVPLDVSINPSTPNPYPITLGDALLLRCRATGGRGTISFSWLKDSTVVTENVTQNSDGISLSITSVQEEDGGTYTCRATSAGGDTDSATRSVVVYVPPTFQVFPQNVTIRARQPLMQNCEATGMPSPTITWLRPNGEVVAVIGGAPQFGTLTRSNTGVYACVANNLAGERRAEFTVTVQDTPLITESPQNKEVRYGQDPVFQCVAIGPPTPNITWSKPGSVIQMGHVTTTNELHLFSVTDSDIGTYQCTADNGLGTATASATLSILDIPMVRFISPSTSLEVGNSFVLNCTASGPPSTILQWYHNATLLPDPSTPGVQISPPGLLTVFSAALSHSGEYTCNASTSYEYSVARVTVIVGTAPQIIAGPSNSDLGPGDRVFLNCEVAGIPRPQIVWYKTDVQGRRSELPIVGDTFTVHTQRLELHDVARDDTGMYECQAGNVLGASSQRATVRVEGIPLATNITPTLLIAGNMATLTCNTLYNFPTPTFSWARVDGTRLPIGRFFIGVDGTLNFSPVQGEDEGEYMCIATNTYGVSNVSNYVTVHVPPAVTISPAQPMAILDSTQILQCSVVGQPVPSILWTLPDGSNPIDISTVPNPQIVPLIPYAFDRTTGDLRITRIKAADAGTYSCMASSIVGTANLEVDLVVKGAAPLNVNVTLRRPTALGFTWDLPPPELSGSLSAFQIEFGPLGSRDRVVMSVDKGGQRLYSPRVQLEEDSTYQFIVRGLYDGGVVGVDAVVITTTLEDAPSAAPQNITLVSLEEALVISWEPPEIRDQNGAITHYNIYYGQSPDAANPTPAFTLIVYPAQINSSADMNLTLTVGNLAGGQSYDVKLQAATAVGPGPNSTVSTATTLRPFPLTLVLSITVPVGTVLLAIVLLVLFCLCIFCLRRHSQSGKHTPLMEEQSFQKQKKKLRQKTISGPIPGITPHIDSSVPGKFTVQAKDGTVLSLNPKVIKEDDVAPPPIPGQKVQQVPKERIMSSQQEERPAAFNPYSTPADSLKAAGVEQRPAAAANTRTPPAAGVQQRPTANNNIPPPSMEGARPTSNIYSEPVVVHQPPPSAAAGQEKPSFPYADDINPYAVLRMVQQPIPEVPEEEDHEEEEDQEEEEEEGEEENGEGLSSSRNVLDLTSTEDTITPAPPTTPTPPTTPSPPTTPQKSEPAFETTRDDVELLYSTVSHEHKVKKRRKMLQQQQKREMKARRDQRKMQEKMRREQKKREVKIRQHSEKELKRRQKEDNRRQELGLANVVRLHDLDLSSQKGRAQAQFIDAATAAIF